MSQPGAPDFGSAADVVQRLSVLLGAGLAPGSAWRHASEPTGTGVGASTLSSSVSSIDVTAELVELCARPGAESMAWSTVAAAWSVATEVGAPLAPTLARLAEVLRELHHAGREVELALAGPRATARIVIALPPLGLLVGMLLGVDALGVLVSTPAGLVCLAAGTLLLILGLRWNRRLIAEARRVDPTAGVGLDLLAIGFSGGATPERGISLVDAALARAGLAPLDDDARDVLAFASRAGIPTSALLRAQADESRRESLATARTKAILLGTRLLLPLGLCVLPSFVLLGVMPVVLAIISTTVAGW